MQKLIRRLPDGRVLYVSSMTFGKFRLNLSETEDSMFFDDGW